jgi:transcriptional regulator with XRE-family HTH domain
VNSRQVGLVIRALRRRRSWRQADLAQVCGTSQALVSRAERGHIESLPLRTVQRLASALDASATFELRWRGGELDRLLDADHAGLGGTFAARLRRRGWHVSPEVTYSTFGERGSIDLLAFHAASGSLLVVEVKTEIVSAEQILRKLDEKARLAADVARERLAWRASSVSRLLVVEDVSTARRRIAGQQALFELALPSPASEVRSWLRAPAGSIAGILFLSPSHAGTAIQKSGGRHRVRVASAGDSQRSRT